MEQLQSPVPVWCGWRNGSQDVFIRLVPSQIDHQQVTDLHSRDAVAVVKVHSHQLKDCSKYFETCLSERWANPHPSTQASHIETSLEVIHALPVACYIDCFSRMYTPFRKNFRDVESSLNLLRVASQIEFRKLTSSICRYLSTIVWSVEDELRIRLYASSLDFPRGQAEDLVTRLEFGDPSNNGTGCGKQLLEMLVKCMKTALRCKDRHSQEPKRNFHRARALIEELILSIGHSGSSVFETDLVAVISHEAEDVLVDFHEECLRQGELNPRVQWYRRIFEVPGFKHKFEGICWILNVLLKARVADEFVECFLQLQSYPLILSAAARASPHNPVSEIAIEFANLVMLIYREVVSGNLLLDIEDRVALIENWQLLDLCSDSNIDVDIAELGYERAAEDVFLTLPFKQQMEFIKRWKFDHHDVISTKSLATLVWRNCRAQEYARGQAGVEVDED